jgi:uncharacterized Zn-binding protein involved in type VI secretion
MPAASRKGDLTAGHACFPPTAIIGSCSKIYINGILASKLGVGVASHRCGKTTHAGRTVTGGSSTVFFENARATRIGDSVNCGDTIGQGSKNVIIG